MKSGRAVADREGPQRPHVQRTPRRFKILLLLPSWPCPRQAAGDQPCHLGPVLPAPPPLVCVEVAPGTWT